MLSHYANKCSLASYTFCGAKKFTPWVLSFPFYLLGSLIIENISTVTKQKVKNSTKIIKMSVVQGDGVSLKITRYAWI